MTATSSAPPSASTARRPAPPRRTSRAARPRRPPADPVRTDRGRLPARAGDRALVAAGRRDRRRARRSPSGSATPGSSSCPAGAGERRRPSGRPLDGGRQPAGRLRRGARRRGRRARLPSTAATGRVAAGEHAEPVECPLAGRRPRGPAGHRRSASRPRAGRSLGVEALGDPTSGRLSLGGDRSDSPPRPAALHLARRRPRGHDPRHRVARRRGGPDPGPGDGRPRRDRQRPGRQGAARLPRLGVAPAGGPPSAAAVRGPGPRRRRSGARSPGPMAAVLEAPRRDDGRDLGRSAGPGLRRARASTIDPPPADHVRVRSGEHAGEEGRWAGSGRDPAVRRRDVPRGGLGRSSATIRRGRCPSPTSSGSSDDGRAARPAGRRRSACTADAAGAPRPDLGVRRRDDRPRRAAGPRRRAPATSSACGATSAPARPSSRRGSPAASASTTPSTRRRSS